MTKMTKEEMDEMIRRLDGMSTEDRLEAVISFFTKEWGLSIEDQLMLNSPAVRRYLMEESAKQYYQQVREGREDKIPTYPGFDRMLDHVVNGGHEDDREQR